MTGVEYELVSFQTEWGHYLENIVVYHTITDHSVFEHVGEDMLKKGNNK